MALKINFLYYHRNDYAETYDAVSDKHGEKFHQDS